MNTIQIVDKEGRYVGADLSGLRGTRTNEGPYVCVPVRASENTKRDGPAGVMLGSPQAFEQQMKLVVYIGTVCTQPPETSCFEYTQLRSEILGQLPRFTCNKYES